jgi:hypothetical protein
MQLLQREYSSDKVPQWLNRKVITCANKLWPVVAFGARCSPRFMRSALRGAKNKNRVEKGFILVLAG